MAPSDKTTRFFQSWPWWRWTLTGLSALALALSSYLSWHYLMGGSVIGCGGGSACEEVLSSRWSAVAGVLPISGLAAGTYLAMLVASLFIGPATPAADRRLAWGAMLVLAGVAAGSAAWFTIVQKWFIGAYCPYCMATHITGLMLGGLVVWKVPRQFGGSSAKFGQMQPMSGDAIGAVSAGTTAEVFPSVSRRMIGLLPAIGLLLAGMLVVCQVGFAPPPIYRGGTLGTNDSAIDAHRAPLIGSADAPYVVTLLFDYKCPHCQKVHSMLDEVVRRYDGKLAFVLCPAPLNLECNPYIPQQVEEFKDSCELAKIGLTVWVAKREAFAVFDRWMFAPGPGDVLWQARSLDAARAKAVELVGRENFDAARADPWIDQYLQTSVGIFGDSMRLDPTSNAVPKLIFGARWVTPKPNNVNELLMVLQESLAVPTP